MGYVLDNEGYLVDPTEWSESLALELASSEGLNLSKDHWVVLHYMQDYWREHRVAPDVRHVIKHLAETLGYDKKTAKQQIFALFPYGYVKQACKISGMQRPRVWSTG